MALHFVRFRQSAMRIRLRRRAGFTPAAKAISATSARGRVSWRLMITVPSVPASRVVMRTQVRMPSRIDFQHLSMPRALDFLPPYVQDALSQRTPLTRLGPCPNLLFGCGQQGVDGGGCVPPRDSPLHAPEPQETTR